MLYNRPLLKIHVFINKLDTNHEHACQNLSFDRNSIMTLWGPDSACTMYTVCYCFTTSVRKVNANKVDNDSKWRAIPWESPTCDHHTYTLLLRGTAKLSRASDMQLQLLTVILVLPISTCSGPGTSCSPNGIYL